MEKEEEKIKNDMEKLEKRMDLLRENEREKGKEFNSVRQDYIAYGRGNLPGKANLEWLHNRYISKFQSKGIFTSASELLDYCQGASIIK